MLELFFCARMMPLFGLCIYIYMTKSTTYVALAYLVLSPSLFYCLCIYIYAHVYQIIVLFIFVPRYLVVSVFIWFILSIFLVKVKSTY